MCVRILRDFAESAGINKNFSIYSETERSNVLKKAFKEITEGDERDDENADYRYLPHLDFKPEKSEKRIVQRHRRIL